MTRPVFVDSRRDLLSALIDYAGLFPPASLDLDAAVAEYRAGRGGANAWMLGTFVVPASRLEDLAASLVATMPGGEEPWDVSVILDGNTASAAAAAAAFEGHMSPAARIVGAEALLPDAVVDGRTSADAAEAARSTAAAAGSVSATVVPYLEIPMMGVDPAALGPAIGAIDTLRSALHRPLAAKLRCGGPTPESFPTCEMVATFLVACRDRMLPFKATAGLHHPIRQHDEELDVMHHGFLNLLMAAALAAAGADVRTVTAAVAEQDPTALKVGTAGLGWKDHRVDAGGIKTTRAQLFASYGSCSFDEPVEYLEALGILSAAPA